MRGNMKNFLTVLKFELGNYFKSKGFVVGSLLMAAVLLLGILIPPFFMNKDKSDTGSAGSAAEEGDKDKYAIYDESGSFDIEKLKALLPSFSLITEESQDKVHSAVEAEDVKAGFIIKDATNYTYVVRSKSMSDMAQSHFEEGMSALYRESALLEAGIDSNKVAEIYATQIHSEVVGKDGGANYWYTYVLIMVVYLLIIFYGQMIATSVTQEKSNRAIEILVTSVNTNSLIFGKVIAGAIGGLVQVVTILAPALVAYSLTKERWGNMLDFLLDIPASVWIVFGIFSMLGYLLYSFMYGMLGALVSKTEDIGKSSSMVMLIFMGSFFIAIFGLMSPDGMLMRVASYVPFTSYNTMFVRVAMGSVKAPEVILSGVLLFATCILVGYFTAKIFRFGTLMYGNPIKLSTAIKKMREK